MSSSESNTGKGLLAPYRVLDLSDEKGLLCGKLLGDLGADVIKVENPGGDAARSLGPFYHDEPHPEKSLFWWAYNTGKRGITLDITRQEGRELLQRLAGKTDFLIESYPPGYLDTLNLGYQSLAAINPGLIMISITPFGQTGPYRDFKSPDIVAWSLGGQQYFYGPLERPPVRVSHHSQSYLHAGAAGAAGAMVALNHRRLTGLGQQVDISIHECIAWMNEWNMMQYDATRLLLTRKLKRAGRNVKITSMWPCQDGYVIFYYGGGAGSQRRTSPFVEWLESENAGDEFLGNVDWERLNFMTVTQDTINRIETPIKKFFAARTREEIYRGALQRRIMIYPVSDVEEITHSPQLQARDFWEGVEHPEVSRTITYPGPFFKASSRPPRIRSRAPLIGEHNMEIYREELGMAPENIVRLEKAGVI